MLNPKERHVSQLSTRNVDFHMMREAQTQMIVPYVKTPSVEAPSLRES